MTTKEVTISARNIGKRYRKNGMQPFYRNVARGMMSMFSSRSGRERGEANEFWALKDISFDIERGQVTGIIGRNGAGKSTLLKILSRITTPTCGTAEIRGRVGSLLEVGTGFHPELTGRENIFLNGAILGMSRKEVLARFDEIVDFSGISGFIDMPVKRYSSGMYTRLAFSVAAHLDTEILFVDEVLAVGDLSFQKKCLGKMHDAVSDGRTILFVSHNMGAIKALCTTCMYLDAGRMRMIGAASDVISEYMKGGERKPYVAVEAEMRHRGGSAFQIDYCAISDSKQNPKTEFLIGEDIELTLGVNVLVGDEVSLWMIVWDANGVPLLCSHQKDVEKVAVTPGRYRMTVRTRNLNLNPGVYSVTAGAVSGRNEIIEWVDKVQSFEVHTTFSSGAPYDGRLGYVNQEVSWEVAPEVGQPAELHGAGRGR
ncbi:ABC transporter ATP-binding protein [Pelagibius sp. CAU 1746]|uniref:ABC transporter ATP-binding protein n=1 Tax=Pelagibius sp. CAU 1746 TaxID=3140370 RepID=UPI00325BFFE0